MSLKDYFRRRFPLSRLPNSSLPSVSLFRAVLGGGGMASMLHVCETGI